MHIETKKAVTATESEQELIDFLAPQLDKGTQFVLIPLVDPMLGKSTKDETLSIFLHKTSSVITQKFETDGQLRRDEGVRYADGTVQRVQVTDWRYAILVNDARRGDNSNKTVTTCYLRERNVFVGIRRALGLPAF
jgi:hypothetical protein